MDISAIALQGLDQAQAQLTDVATKIANRELLPTAPTWMWLT
jgi:hypothetical protein